MKLYIKFKHYENTTFLFIRDFGTVGDVEFEKFDMILNVELYTQFLAATLLTIITIAAVVLASYGVYNLTNDWFANMVSNDREKKAKTIVSRLYKETDVEEMFTSSKLRKYQLREFVVNAKVKDKLVNKVTDILWKDYKS